MRRHQVRARAHGWPLLAWAMAWLLASSGLTARAQGPINATINDVETDRFPKVVAYVTVSDDNGRAVVKLPAEAFSLAEDGTPVKNVEVELVENAGAPILLVLALDISGSMRGTALRNTKAAAVQLIQDLGPADQVAVLSFDDKVTVPFELSADKPGAAAAVNALAVGGNTALNDAVEASVRLLADRPRGRKAVVVLTDGKDEGSTLTMDDAIGAAQAANIPVYAIGFGPQIQPDVLEGLALNTGGHFYQTPTSNEIYKSFEEVASLLRYQYVLRFESALAADDAEHPLSATVTVEGAQAEAEATFVAGRGTVTVAMLAPGSGETVGGLVTLKPRIDAPAEVVRVEYLLDGAPLASVTTGEFAYEWDATAVPLGPHTLTVRATDRAGNTGQTELAMTVARPVEVSFLSPPGDRPVSGAVPVEVQVGALAGMAQVVFAVDGQEVASAASPPWRFTWDTTVMSTGAYTLTATAFDARSQSAVASQAVWVGLRLALPALADGATVGGRIPLEPRIDAPGDVRQVEYLLDGDPLATTTSGDFSYDWDASGAKLGPHTLTMRVADSAGNQEELSFDLVLAEPLVVTFVSPTEEEREKLSGEVPVEVEVAALHEVDRVEFTVDGQVVHTAGDDPYRFLWDTTALTSGRHELVATAYDAIGQSDREVMDAFVAFRGSNGGLWVVLLAVLVGAGLVIPLARRRRRATVPQGTGPAPAAVAPRAGPAEAKPARGSTPLSSAAAWLVVEEGPDAGSRWPLPAGETRLGRTRSANDIVIPSRSASRRHAAIRADADGCVYYDIEPTNPTLINGAPIVGAYELVEGDRITIGDVVLRYAKEGMR